jgi:pyrophosphate--fructose-6-phosphate 1-phosphotransferase
LITLFVGCHGACLNVMQVKSMVKPGCSQDVLKAALSSMAHVTELLTIMSSPSYNGQATI